MNLFEITPSYRHNNSSVNALLPCSKMELWKKIVASFLFLALEAQSDRRQDHNRNGFSGPFVESYWETWVLKVSRKESRSETNKNIADYQNKHVYSKLEKLYDFKYSNSTKVDLGNWICFASQRWDFSVWNYFHSWLERRPAKHKRKSL